MIDRRVWWISFLFLTTVKGFGRMSLPRSYGSSISFYQQTNTKLFESEGKTRGDFLCFVGTILTSSIVSISTPAMADDIKTLDLSLPSYDSINTLKLSVETEAALGVEAAPPPQGKAAVTKPMKKKESILPSMNKSNAKKTKPQKTTEKSEKAMKQSNDQKLDYETMDMSLPSYSTNTKPKEKDIFSI